MRLSPKTLRLALFGLVAGLFAGVGLGLGLSARNGGLDGDPSRPAPPTAHDLAAPAPHAPAAAGADPVAGCDLPDPLTRRLALQRHLHAERLRSLRATERELLGDPPGFADDLDPKWRPEAIRAAVARALDGTEFHNIEVDCEEFPCMVAADFTRTSRGGSGSLLGTLSGEGYERLGQLSTFHEAGGRGVLVVAPPAPTDERTKRRARLRSYALLTPAPAP
jgi:hypothetical protein